MFKKNPLLFTTSALTAAPGGYLFVTFPFKLRHCTVVAVADEEYRRLETTSPAKTEASSTQ